MLCTSKRKKVSKLFLYPGILLSKGFDQFNKETSDVFNDEIQTIKDTAASLYHIEMKAAAYLAVIAIILLGASFLFPKNVQEKAQNKIWLMRIVGIIIFLFGAGPAIIQAVSDAVVAQPY